MMNIGLKCRPLAKMLHFFLLYLAESEQRVQFCIVQKCMYMHMLYNIDYISKQLGTKGRQHSKQNIVKAITNEALSCKAVAVTEHISELCIVDRSIVTREAEDDESKAYE